MEEPPRIEKKDFRDAIQYNLAFKKISAFLGSLESRRSLVKADFDILVNSIFKTMANRKPLIFLSSLRTPEDILEKAVPYLKKIERPAFIKSRNSSRVSQHVAESGASAVGSLRVSQADRQSASNSRLVRASSASERPQFANTPLERRVLALEQEVSMLKKTVADMQAQLRHSQAVPVFNPEEEEVNRESGVDVVVNPCLNTVDPQDTSRPALTSTIQPSAACNNSGQRQSQASSGMARRSHDDADPLTVEELDAAEGEPEMDIVPMPVCNLEGLIADLAEMRFTLQTCQTGSVFNECKLLAFQTKLKIDKLQLLANSYSLRKSQALLRQMRHDAEKKCTALAKRLENPFIQTVMQFSGVEWTASKKLFPKFQLIRNAFGELKALNPELTEQKINGQIKAIRLVVWDYVAEFFQTVAPSDTKHPAQLQQLLRYATITQWNKELQDYLLQRTTENSDIYLECELGCEDVTGLLSLLMDSQLENVFRLLLILAAIAFE